MAGKSPRKITAEQPRLLRGTAKDATSSTQEHKIVKESQKLAKHVLSVNFVAKTTASEVDGQITSTNKQAKIASSAKQEPENRIPSVEELLSHIDGLSKENRLLATRLNRVQMLLEQKQPGLPPDQLQSTNLEEVRRLFLNKLEVVMTSYPVSSNAKLEPNEEARKLREAVKRTLVTAQDSLKTQVSLLAMQLKVQKLNTQDISFLHSVLLRFHPSSAQMDSHKLVELCQTLEVQGVSSPTGVRPHPLSRGLSSFGNSSTSVLSTPSFGDSTRGGRVENSQAPHLEIFVKECYSLWMWLLLSIGPEKSIHLSENSSWTRKSNPSSQRPSSFASNFEFSWYDSSTATRTVGPQSKKSWLDIAPEYLIVPEISILPGDFKLTSSGLFLKAECLRKGAEAHDGQVGNEVSETDGKGLVFHPNLKGVGLLQGIQFQGDRPNDSDFRERPVKSSLSGRSLSKEGKGLGISNMSKKSVKFSERCSVLEYETEKQPPLSPRDHVANHSGIGLQKEDKGFKNNERGKGLGLVEFESKEITSFSRLKPGINDHQNKENIPAPVIVNGVPKHAYSGIQAARKPAINLKELELNPKNYASKKPVPIASPQAHFASSQPSMLSVSPQQLLLRNPISEDYQNQTLQAKQIQIQPGNHTPSRPRDCNMRTLRENRAHSDDLQSHGLEWRPPGEHDALNILGTHRFKANRGATIGHEANESAIARSEDDSVVISSRKRADFEGFSGGSLLKKRSSSQQELRSTRKLSSVIQEKDSLLNELRSHRLQRSTNHGGTGDDKSMQLRSAQSESSLLGLSRGYPSKPEKVLTNVQLDHNKRLLDNTPLNMEAFRKSIDKTLSRNQNLKESGLVGSDQVSSGKAVRPWFGFSQGGGNMVSHEPVKAKAVVDEGIFTTSQNYMKPSGSNLSKLGFLHSLSGRTMHSSIDLTKDPRDAWAGCLVPTPHSERGHFGTSTYMKFRNARGLPQRSSLQSARPTGA